MQEYIEEKALQFIIRMGTIVCRLLARTIETCALEIDKQHKEFNCKRYKAAHADTAHSGEKTVKQLLEQNAELPSIEIADKNISAFKAIIQKHEIDIELKAESSANPPKWLAFFKTKDADAMTKALSEFTAKVLKPESERPSVLERLRKAKERVVEPVVDKTRVMERGSPEL